MSTEVAVIFGVWSFAISTVLSKNITGWFVWVTYLLAISISVLLLIE